MRKSTAASSSSLSTGMKVGASNASKWEQRRQVDSFRKNAMGNGTSKTVAVPLASQANQISRLFRMARKSGHLNLTSKELHEVPDQVLHLFHFLEEVSSSCIDVFRIRSLSKWIVLYRMRNHGNVCPYKGLT
jgi:hypothetical protein